MRLKIGEDIQTTPIEVTTSSLDVADEEQFLFTQADNNDESEEQAFDRKKQSKQNAKKWAANDEPSSLKTVKEFTNIEGNTTSYSMKGIKANSRIRVEQDVDLVLKYMKLKILGQPQWWGINVDRLTIQKFSEMAYCSGKILEKQVVSNTTKITSPRN